jgi:hypothetical protein
LISLILMLLNVSFLVIPQPKRDIVAIVLFFDATSLAPMSHLLSLLPIFLLLLLWVILPLSLMLRPFHCLVPPLSESASPSPPVLLPPRSPAPLQVYTHVILDHQLLHLHHHPYIYRSSVSTCIRILAYCLAER